MSFDHKSRMTRHAVKHSCSLKAMIFNRGSRQARTQGAMQGMHPPNRPKEVLTWHLISLKIIAKIFFTAHYVIV